tara:strand:+ start:102 stop:1076 length:975 start_codon:yes stop_codon:yes gene_type:complete
MTFFNPKEDVLDIELTQYGKWSLSQGKLKPSYYLFFDDDILYDAASGGITENQTSSAGRVQEETPKLRTQYSFRAAAKNVASDSLPTTVEEHFSLVNSLGTSDITTNSFPKWNFRMYGEDGPQIDNATEYMTSSFATLRIPQIDIKCKFKTAVHAVDSNFTINEDPNLSSPVQADGTYVAVQPRTILAQIVEDNVAFEKENFDVEVYLKETETISGDGGTDLDNWTRLVFKKKISNIVDGILLDDQPEICHDLDPTYVEYYFDIFADNEIDETSMEQVEDMPIDKNMYTSLSSEKTTPTTSTLQMADIYSKVVPDDPCPDDSCP